MVKKQTSTQYLLTLLAVISLTPISLAWSASAETEELKAQQQKLRELLDRIGEAQDQRGKQRATIKKLEKQMSCNWGLIQDYDNCEKKYADNLEAHVDCKRDAKEKAIECLSLSSE